MVGDADNDLILRSALARVSKDGPPGTAHGSRRAKGAPHHEDHSRNARPERKTLAERPEPRYTTKMAPSGPSLDFRDPTAMFCATFEKSEPRNA
jgi:hypothetical protein